MGGPPLAIRTIDLFGCAADGRPVLWKQAMRVAPVSAFGFIGCWIACGHYIIDYKGNAIVVHCANLSDKRISVQFLLGEPVAYAAARHTVEPMLLGKVIVSAEQQAAVFEQRRLSNLFKDKESL
jgi:hypothetical protein